MIYADDLVQLRRSAMHHAMRSLVRGGYAND